jgi:hypothetical protein
VAYDQDPKRIFGLGFRGAEESLEQIVIPGSVVSGHRVSGPLIIVQLCRPGVFRCRATSCSPRLASGCNNLVDMMVVRWRRIQSANSDQDAGRTNGDIRGPSRGAPRGQSETGPGRSPPRGAVGPRQADVRAASQAESADPCGQDCRARHDHGHFLHDRIKTISRRNRPDGVSSARMRTEWVFRVGKA